MLAEQASEGAYQYVALLNYLLFIEGEIMIYLDNSATTKPYAEVMESFVKVSTDYYGNPSSLHGMGVQAEKLLSTARKQIADLLKVKNTEVFLLLEALRAIIWLLKALHLQSTAWQTYYYNKY